MTQIAHALTLLSLLLNGGLFGFFYAWVCSTMWGLDTADPRVAISAMQAMNGSVRNAVFAPVFFGTPIVLLLTTAVLAIAGQRRALPFFIAATVIVAVLGFGLTAVVHIPMNNALGAQQVPSDLDAARAIWESYSPDWQFWNQARTIACGVGMLLVGLGIHRLNQV